MTLRVSKNKTSPAIGLMRSTLAKNAGVIILMSIAMLIFCPGIFLTVLSKTIFRAASNYSYPDYLSVLYGVTAVVSCILVCICNYVNFSYLYKKHSSDVFHSLPLTRTGLLFSRALAGIIEVLIPVTLGYVSLFALTFVYPSYALGTFPQIASAYIVNVLLILAASAYSMIFIICAGSAFDLVLSFFGFNAAVLVVCGIVHSLCDEYLSGCSAELMTGFFRFMSPVYFIAEKGVIFAGENLYKLSDSYGIVLSIIAFSALFFIASAWLYNYRKAERGEQAYAYRFVYIICAVLAGICGGYALSEIFTFSADAKELSPIGLISFAAGSVITVVVYGAVTNRGFKKIKNSIVLGAVSFLIYSLTALIIFTGAFGFENRMPEIEKVTGVTVSFDDALVTFNDANRALKLHKAILENNADDEYEDTVDTPHTYVKIIYNLDSKGNNRFIREYFVDKTKVKKELFDIYASDERFDGFLKAIDETKSDRIEIWGGYDTDTEDGAYVNLDGSITKREAKELLSVYKRELTAIGPEFYSAKNQTKSAEITATLVLNDIGDKPFNIYTTEDFPETNWILRSFAIYNQVVE